MRKYIKIIISIAIFVSVLIGINFINNSQKPKFVTYDMDASNSKHYELGDKIKIKHNSFSILDYQNTKPEGDIELLLDLDITEKVYQLLHDEYTFGLAYDDEYILGSNCDYNNNKIYVINSGESKNKKFNQFVIIKNETLKIIATINLNNE